MHNSYNHRKVGCAVTCIVLVVAAVFALGYHMFSASYEHEYDTLSSKEFLFMHQNMRLSIDGGEMLDKNITSEQIGGYCYNADGKLLTLHRHQGGSSYFPTGELLLTKYFKRIPSTNLFVKAGSG